MFISVYLYPYCGFPTCFSNYWLKKEVDDDVHIELFAFVLKRKGQVFDEGVQETCSVNGSCSSTATLAQSAAPAKRMYLSVHGYLLINSILLYLLSICKHFAQRDLLSDLLVCGAFLL